MKTLIKILFLCMLTVLLNIAAMANEPTATFKPVSGKEKTLFVLKADKKLVGAKIEILNENGSVIAEQILKKRKVVIDFKDLKSGSYVIRLAKGDIVQEFTYAKNQV